MRPNPPTVTDMSARWLRSWRPGRAAARALLGLVCLGQGCLVTDDVNYNRLNAPPQLKKLKPSAFTAVISDCKGDDLKDQRMGFEVSVYDADVEDELLIRVLVEHEFKDTYEVPLTGRPERDAFKYCMDLEDLNRGCSYVEIIVSSTFTDPAGNRDPYGTTDPTDLARVDWFVPGLAESYPEVGVSECQGKGGEP